MRPKNLRCLPKEMLDWFPCEIYFKQDADSTEDFLRRLSNYSYLTRVI